MPKDKTIKERMAVMETEVKNLSEDVKTGFEGVGVQLTALNGKFDKLDKKYVTKVEFAPVQKFVYAIIGAVGLAVIGAVLALILR